MELNYSTMNNVFTLFFNIMKCILLLILLCIMISLGIINLGMVDRMVII